MFLNCSHGPSMSYIDRSDGDDDPLQIQHANDSPKSFKTCIKKFYSAACCSEKNSSVFIFSLAKFSKTENIV